MTNKSTESPPPDVGTILEGLRAEVRARRLARGVADLGPHERDLSRALDEVELHRVVSAHWPLTARTLPGRALALVNKVVRRSLRWYINPIVEQQNAYNDAAARTLRLLADAYLDLAEQLAEARASELPPPATGDHGSAGGDRRPATHSAPIAADPQQAHDGEGLANEHTAALMDLVRLRGAAEPPARFPDLELLAQEPRLRELQQVSAHWQLGGTTTGERTVAMVKRIVRQYLRWLINPIVEQQNAANGALTDALAAATRVDTERRGAAARLRAERRPSTGGR
jgi:hypothetical protein